MNPMTPPASEPNPVCPACGIGRLRRSHRRNLLESVRSWFGSYPYRCPECRRRYFRPRSRHAGGEEEGARLDNRPESSRRRRARTWRQVLFYLLALALFIAFLRYIMREPAP